MALFNHFQIWNLLPVNDSETMGNATAVCSDKTGTLTENRMTVVSAALAELHFTNRIEFGAWRYNVHPVALELAVEGIALNSTAFEGKDGNYVGSTTESAMLEFIKRLGYSYQEIRQVDWLMNTRHPLYLYIGSLQSFKQNYGGLSFQFRSQEHDNGDSNERMQCRFLYT